MNRSVIQGVRLWRTLETHDERHHGNCEQHQRGTQTASAEAAQAGEAGAVGLDDARRAHLMDLAAGLPLEADRTGPLGNAQRYMRYQWIVRLLGNALVVSDAVMEPFARDVLEQAAADGEPLCLILDQVSDRHQMLMLALRWGGSRPAAGLAGRAGAIGVGPQKAQVEGGAAPLGGHWPGCGCWATGFTALPT